jgi:ubiquinone/menaquinone biosynthesis C-methylase UbiE
MSDRDAQAYYASGPAELAPTVLKALAEAGRATESLDPDDLAALDEFHGLGRAATLALAELAAISPGERVLDLGAGIGGPARTLARHFDARVCALDPTERFCVLAEELNTRAGLADRIQVVCADARQMPLPNAGFDLILTQAVWPSIADKPAMLAEAHRVLVPGGRLAIYEAMAGPGEGELRYPLPWADGPDESFVIDAARARELAAEAGFAVSEWLQSPEVLARIGAIAGSDATAMSSGVPGVDLSLLMPDFEVRMAGVAKNLEAGRIELTMALMVAE